MFITAFALSLLVLGFAAGLATQRTITRRHVEVMAEMVRVNQIAAQQRNGRY